MERLAGRQAAGGQGASCPASSTPRRTSSSTRSWSSQRIQSYARLVGKENVIAGVDCGFGTNAASTNVDPKIVWAKLQALSEGAAIASKRLW